MAPKKLTEPDKKEILELYRNPEETTSTLAGRYGVSNSTISRLLKATLPAAEYSALIQQKRAAADKSAADKTAPQIKAPEPEPEPAKPEATKAPKLKDRQSRSRKSVKDTTGVDSSEPPSPPAPAAETPSPSPEVAQPAAASQPHEASDETAAGKPRPARRRRSRAPEADTKEAAQLSIPEPEEQPEEKPPEPRRSVPQPVLRGSASAVPEDVEELEADWDTPPTLDDDYGGDEDEDEDDYDDEDGWDETEAKSAPHLDKLEIYPLTDAKLPQLCYVVVERSSSELVALPLRTFADLGQIPETEGDSRTLPIFDNHRVARRFSRRNQRVVKVPDGSMLQTTSSYLQAKGITRLLIDGQVFALDDEAVVNPV